MFCNKTDSRRTMGRLNDNTLEGDDNRNNNRPSFFSPRASSLIPIRKSQVSSGTNTRKEKSLITQELESKKDRPRVKAPPAKSRTSQGIETKAMHPSVSTQRSNETIYEKMTSIDECIGRKWSCAATFPVQMLATNPEEKDLTSNLCHYFWIPHREKIPEPQNTVVKPSDGTRIVITHPPPTNPDNCSRTSAKNEDSIRNVSHQSAYHARPPRSTLESIPSGKVVVLDTSSPSHSQPVNSILISEPCVATPIPTTVDVCVMTDNFNLNTDMEPKDCPNCKLFQTMFSQSESNRSYVTKVLAESNVLSTGRVEPRTVNPLVLKALIESTEKMPSIPSFDMESFKKQYIQRALFNKDLSKRLFSPNQLFHIALAARDAMAQAVLQELGTAERVLKGRYKYLVSLSETGPVRESEFWQIIDGYRRFVRGSEEEVALGMIYSTKQTVTIDGVQYDAVVIPVQKKEPL